MRVIQLQNRGVRRLALVDEPRLRVLRDFPNLHALATEADRLGIPLVHLAGSAPIEDTIPYDPVYLGHGPWRILPALDHPAEPSRCLVSGTGLTHTGSAAGRNAMHAQAANGVAETDSMRMFRWGCESGKPTRGTIGVAPEWFYKGTGGMLRSCGEDLEIPPFAEGGGEESEIAGLYLVGMDGTPRRIGYAIGNEFSDHVFEKRNYLYLAHSKLRSCSLGPEAIIGEELPETISGRVIIERRGLPLWEKALLSGEANMSHSLENIEHHHFKYSAHCRPGDAHVHFFGAAALSYSHGILLESGDTIDIAWEGFGRPLRNSVVTARGAAKTVVPIRAL